MAEVMKIDHVVKACKRLARTYKKKKPDNKHHENLDLAAQAMGYKHYSHLTYMRKDADETVT